MAHHHHTIPHHVSMLLKSESMKPLEQSGSHPYRCVGRKLQEFQEYVDICMLDGPDYPTVTGGGKSRHDDLLNENMRLKALLAEHGISWVPAKPAGAVKVHKMKTRKSAAAMSNLDLPHLPMEIQLRIIGFAIKCSFPIIDPFTKPRYEHLTKDERAQRKEYPVQILAVCKAYHDDGRKLFFSNEFVFTQVAALENFALVSRELRSTIKHVTLRVVGKYYDDEPTKRDILHHSYHPAVTNFKTPIYGRPKGAETDRGIQAYCWQQFADFMMNLQVPSASCHLTKLFPSLTRMRVDLVNFSEHLHYPGPNFASVLRWHTGPFLDELIITGVPEDEPEEGPEQMFMRIVKDEGIFSSGHPVFVSNLKSLKPLAPLGLVVRCVRADEETKFLRALQTPDRKARKRLRAVLDPEDGKPPRSFYPPGRTIWKFTQDSLRDPTRKWIEFERESGWPADDIDIWSEIMDEDDDYMIYDSDGNLHFDADGNPLESDADMDTDAEMPDMV